MRKKEIEVHEFDFHIYPRTLLVIIGHDWDKITSLFEGEFESDPFVSCDAIVFKANHKELNKGVIVACFYDRKHMNSNIISHECVHVASNIFSDCGMTIGFEDGKDEHFAYLVGYAAECCEKAKKRIR